MPILVNLDVMLARRKMRSKELAAIVGITEANLSLLKSGKVKGVRFDTLEAICRALGCQPGDLPRIAAIQDRVRASHGQAGRIRGSIEIKVSGGCRTTRIPVGPVFMSSFLRPSRDETYITLVDGLDLRQFIPVADWQAKIPACGA